MSSREDDLLKRQREMANRISLARASAAAASAAASKKKKKPPPPPGGPPPRGVVGKKSSTIGVGIGTTANPIVLSDGDDSTSHNNNTQKRPSLKRPTPRTNTAEMALAQARQRANLKQSSTMAAKQQSNASTSHVPKQQAQLKRPAMRRNNISASQSNIVAKGNSSTPNASTSAAAGGSLSSILLSNKETAQYLKPNAPKLLKHYNKIEPNDYWKNIRSWDFLSDLNDKMTGNGQKKKSSSISGNNGKRKRDDSDTATDVTENKHKPLPNKFDTYREYCALWAPLCLDEVRAQLLSDAITEIPYWRSKPEKKPIRIQLQPLKKDVNGSSENMGVQVKCVLTENYRDRQFIANDIVLLMKKEKYIWDASKGALLEQNNNHNQQQQKTQHQSRFGIVGHIEYTRKSVDGLTIQVSRELWKECGTSEMVLLKLGCNITSLREFTALCRMDSIPLLDYILGNKMPSSSKQQSLIAQKMSNDMDDYDMIDPSVEVKHAKKEILSSMGGSSTLGMGFAEFASHKFNLSQLGAISASAQEYGDGGFTLIKGPPGTGKTTTLCALLNALHIRQMNQYFEEVKKLAQSYDAVVGKRASLSLSSATKKRPRILVCAPSNAAVDNVILKIMEDGFVDGNGCRYNPSIARIGRGQSTSVKDVCLEEKVEGYISDAMDITKLDQMIEGYKGECRRIHSDITKLRQRMNAIKNVAGYPLAKEWEIRIDEDTLRVYFVNHKTKITTYEVPPPPEPGQRHFPPEAMPEYKAFVTRVVKLVERYNNISTKLERYSLCQDVSNVVQGGANCHPMNLIRQQVETHVIDSTHIVMTTLGTAGNRSLEAANKFEVVVIDEAAQSVEPSTLAGLQLGSSHAILVGDPQQLPATIFNVSGRNTKYDRSLFQRLEEAGHAVHLLNTQYRMHPAISDFPRRIFYDGKLLDGPNVKHPEYGNPLKRAVFRKFQSFQPFTVLDLESSEERGGTSLSNAAEAQLALHLFNNLRSGTNGESANSRVAVVSYQSCLCANQIISLFTNDAMYLSFEYSDHTLCSTGGTITPYLF